VRSSTSFGGRFDLERKQRRIAELNDLAAQPEFWNDQKKAQELTQEKSRVESEVSEFERLSSGFADALAYLELYEEDRDDSLLGEAAQQIASLEPIFASVELRKMLAEPADPKNAILTINAGAGGTESQDWAEMLLRMYQRWANDHQMKADLIDVLQGDEAGVKNATLTISGENAYGLLKGEAGVHRLVRISPFDSNKRRHTSFTSVFVSPEIDEDFEVEINPADLRIDVYRASGAGGQHVNTTDSAVRITHEPTGIVVTCQQERSQHKNKDKAMKVLRSRLYERHLEEERAKAAELEATKKEIGWGSQIRSYVLHPYKMVKDHRTGFSTSSSDKVLDGELDEFIKSFLAARVTGEWASGNGDDLE
jgi:peptide chain release factor 2